MATLFSRPLHTHQGPARGVRRDSRPPTHALLHTRVQRALLGGKGRRGLASPGLGRARVSDLYSSREAQRKSPASHEPQTNPGAPAFSPCETHHDSGCRSSYPALTPQAKGETCCRTLRTREREKKNWPTRRRARSRPAPPRERGVAAPARTPIRFLGSAQTTDARTRRRKKRATLSRLF